MLGVGPFQIKVGLQEDGSAPSSEGAEPENPFEDPVDQFVSALDALTATYERAAPERRDEALADALRTAHGPARTHGAVQAAVHRFVGEGGEGEEAAAREETESEGPFVTSGAEWPVLRTVTDALATVLEVPHQFRREFLGHSLSPPPETRFLYEGEGAVLRSALLDSALSGEEREKRFQYVREAADALVRHQIAVVDGYKASVMEGLQELLTRIDPDEHRDDVLDEYDVFGYVPVLAQPAVLERVRAECRDLLQEDWSVAEQRIFRPAFRKAYLAQMTIPHRSGTEDSPEE